MIEGMKPYTQYKESGLPWLGQCPIHWELRRTKVLFQERVQKGYPNEPLLAATQLKGVVLKERYETRTVTAQKDLHLLKLVEVGDYVISLRSFQGGIEVAYDRGIISPAYTVLRPKSEYANGYYTHFFKSKPFVDSLTLFVTGIREGQNVEYPRLSRAAMPLPPVTEQAAIVRFLDHANRKIERFIRAKKKTIALLNEQKQAIIHRAVTRGLDPDVKLKPSGIDWLGDIPEHWDNPLLGRCINRIEQGWSPAAAEGELSDNQWCVLTLSSVRKGVFNPEAIKPIRVTAQIPNGIEVQNGDLLLTRSNTRERVGDACVVQGVRQRTILCDLIYRLTLNKNVLLPQYLVYYLISPLGRNQIEVSARGSSGTMPKISQSHIKSWRLFLPQPIEQRAIIDSIQEKTETINAALVNANREIELIQEYRTCLNADIVTGKLDVREASTKLPDLQENVELEAFDDLADDELMNDEDLGEEA